MCNHELELQTQTVQIENMARYIAELRNDLAKRDTAMQQLSAVVRQQQRTIRALRAAGLEGGSKPLLANGAAAASEAGA